MQPKCPLVYVGLFLFILLSFSATASISLAVLYFSSLSSWFPSTYNMFSQILCVLFTKLSCPVVCMEPSLSSKKNSIGSFGCTPASSLSLMRMLYQHTEYSVVPTACPCGLRCTSTAVLLVQFQFRPFVACHLPNSFLLPLSFSMSQINVPKLIIYASIAPLRPAQTNTFFTSLRSSLFTHQSAS